jgi:hypothetical protein
MKKETDDKKTLFDKYYPQVIYILDFFGDFLMNKILSNINLE